MSSTTLTPETEARVGPPVDPPEAAGAALPPAPWTAWLIALAGWTAFVGTYGLSGGAGLEVTDAWVAQTAREMSRSDDWHDWLLPKFSGQLRIQKSPGPYWATIAAAKLRGTPVDLASVRLPNAVFAVLLVLTVAWLTRHLAGVRAAVFAGFAAAGSAVVLYWSHRGASDLGVATLCAVSLACLWIGSETPGSRRRQVALWLLGYLAAGLGMLWKMPVPLVAVGLPALLYLLVCNRWRILASRWHLPGLLLFALPWLPWVGYVLASEPTAWARWKIEYLDRFTGSAPNYADNTAVLTGLGQMLGILLLMVFPFTLSVGPALARVWLVRDIDRRGRWLIALWFTSLLIFFLLAADRASRYLLPVLPPLFVLLGIELSAFFATPPRRTSTRAGRITATVVSLLLIAAAVAGFVVAGRYYQRVETWLPAPWSKVAPQAAITAGLFVAGAVAATWLYALGRRERAFGLLVAGLWAAWLWGWPRLMPLVRSDAPFVDLAAQIRSLPAELHDRIYAVGQPEPRVVWYADVPVPRLIDQLELLKLEGGRRDLKTEMRIVGQRIIERLASDEPVLLLASPRRYVLFRTLAPQALAREGRALPPVHLWAVARVGKPDQRYLVFGNRPPPWPEPRPEWLTKMLARARQRLATQPATRAHQPR